MSVLRFPSSPPPDHSGIKHAVRPAGQSHGTKARFERWERLLAEPIHTQEEFLRWAGVQS